MVKDLIHDPILLARKSAAATEEDLPAGRDLLDTLLAHRETCAGMAGNMIGVLKRIIVFFDGELPVLMLNPELLKAEQPYDTQEGCLSLLGEPRKTRRYRKIKLRWQNEQLQTRIKTFEGWTAQVIQHEIDHCNVILI